MNRVLVASAIGAALLVAFGGCVGDEEMMEEDELTRVLLGEDEAMFPMPLGPQEEPPEHGEAGSRSELEDGAASAEIAEDEAAEPPEPISEAALLRWIAWQKQLDRRTRLQAIADEMSPDDVNADIDALRELPELEGEPEELEEIASLVGELYSRTSRLGGATEDTRQFLEAAQAEGSPVERRAARAMLQAQERREQETLAELSELYGRENLELILRHAALMGPWVSLGGSCVVRECVY